MKVFFFRADIINGNRVVKTKLDTFYKMSFAVRDSNLSNIYATKRFGVRCCNCNLFTHKALGVLMNSFKRVRTFRIELKVGSVGF